MSVLQSIDLGSMLLLSHIEDFRAIVKGLLLGTQQSNVEGKIYESEVAQS